MDYDKLGQLESAKQQIKQETQELRDGSKNLISNLVKASKALSLNKTASKEPDIKDSEQKDNLLNDLDKIGEIDTTKAVDQKPNDFA